jgi:hypothetical protein
MSEPLTKPPMRTATFILAGVAFVLLLLKVFTRQSLLLPASIGGIIIFVYFGVKVPRGWVNVLCWIAAALLAVGVGLFLFSVPHKTF